MCKQVRRQDVEGFNGVAKSIYVSKCIGTKRVYVLCVLFGGGAPKEDEGVPM